MVVVQEASSFLGIGAEIAAAITESCFYALRAPVLRVGAYNIPYPPAKVEDEFLPERRSRARCDRSCTPLLRVGHERQQRPFASPTWEKG